MHIYPILISWQCRVTPTVRTASTFGARESGFVSTVHPWHVREGCRNGVGRKFHRLQSWSCHSALCEEGRGEVSVSWRSVSINHTATKGFHLITLKLNSQDIFTSIDKVLRRKKNYISYICPELTLRIILLHLIRAATVTSLTRSNTTKREK